MTKDLRECRLEDLPGPKSKQELDEMKMPYEDYCKAVFAPGHEMGKPEALKGIRWLSTTMYIFTPHSVANLAELGAEVIKVEMPRMGDPMKHTSPFNEAYLYPLHDTRPMTGTGYGFTSANVNEYYLSMDYHLPEMKEAFYRLIKMSDGLTECYRPGTFDRWKQSYRLRPGAQPPVHLCLGRRLRVWAQVLRRLLRHPGAGPRGSRLGHRHARVHGRPLHQAFQLVH